MQTLPLLFQAVKASVERPTLRSVANAVRTGIFIEKIYKKMSKSQMTLDAMKTKTVKVKKNKTVNFKKVKADQAKSKPIKKVAKMTPKKLDDTPDVKTEEFDLDVFITQKLGR